VAGHLRVLRQDFTKIETVLRALSKLKAKDVLEFLFCPCNQRVYVAAAGRNALALECNGNLAPRHGLFEHVLAQHELHDAVDLAEILKSQRPDTLPHSGTIESTFENVDPLALLLWRQAHRAL
jgi:hypothetical protein